LGFDPLLESDASAYSRYYSQVDVCRFHAISDLLGGVGAGYDVVHLFCATVCGGFLEAAGDRLSGTQLIAECFEHGTKVLWIAAENKPDEYIRGFPAAGQRLNLVMTISRAGSNFCQFLDRLLSFLARGSSIPEAWAALAPQVTGAWQADLPSCIFFAGWPNAVLTRRS
jgi:hypothetical protein